MTENRIGLDVRMLQNSGIGTYLRGLLSGFRTLGRENDLKLFGSRELNANLFRNPDLESKPGFSCVYAPVPFTAPIYSIQEQLQYPALVRQCHLWHSPHYNVPLWKGQTKLVVTIHDIIHWIFRKQLLSPVHTAYAVFMLKRAVASADHIIAVSHHTKRDLVEHFQAPEQKITVIHQGVDEVLQKISPNQQKLEAEKLRIKYKLPEKFFLYVGLIKPHKNVLRLVQVFRKLKSQGKVRAALVLIGRKDKTYPQGFEDLTALTSSKGLHYLPVIDPHELTVFYRQALALIHPSLYEGFGLTLLEAMSFGTPVLTTNSASIPEVVGDAALRVDATDETAMADAIMRLEQDAGLRESLRQKGLERVKLFSWTETARKTAKVYEHTLKQNDL